MATFSLRRRFSRSGLWSLFLIAAFPVHVWTLILVFRDFSWVAERTNAWDALGVGAYGLLVAFVESVFVFLAILLLSLLVSLRWEENRRVALLSVLILLTAIWAILNQLYFLAGWSIPAALFDFLLASGHPLRWLYVLLLVVVLPSVAIPVYFVLRSDKVLVFMEGLIERLSLLTILYLLLDAAALILVILRNL